MGRAEGQKKRVWIKATIRFEIKRMRILRSGFMATVLSDSLKLSRALRSNDGT